MATNVPPPQFTALGFVAPPEEEILAGVFADIDAAFGGGLNPALNTPQGQLSSSQASIVGNVYDLFCNITNQVDPAFADGRMQDAIARIYFITRRPAEATVVQATCFGLSGVTIPIGALAKAQDGNVYTATGSGAIGLSGSVGIPFACNLLGPVPCAAGTLDAIYQAIPGWDSITNADDGVLGSDTESRQQFESRRGESVAINSVGALNAILASVLSVAGVLDAYATENSSGSGVVTKGVALVAHSLYVAAVGGTDLDVATAIWRKKSPGCAYNGNTTIQVVDDSVGYSPPLPTYNVTFERPASLNVLFQVNIVNSAGVPANAVALIQAALISAFAGADGGTRARIGSTLYATRYVAPITALGLWAQVASIFVGSTNTAAASVTGSIGGTVMNVTGVISGALAVGQTISGSGVTVGTRIASLGTGVGGVGTYNLTLAQTVPSQTIKASTAASGSVDVHADQVPVLSASEIQVTLI